MREEFVSSLVVLVGFKAQEGLVACVGPELADEFEATLVLAPDGFDGTGSQRHVDFYFLGMGRRALLDVFACTKDFPIVERFFWFSM